MAVDRDETGLIQMAIGGDRVALSRLLLAYTDEVEGQVIQLLSRDPHEAISAEDILQQTFVRATLAISSFQSRPGVSFGAWLFTIARNLVRDSQRRRRRERRATVNSNGEDQSEQPVRPGLNEIAAEITSPSGFVQRRDNCRRIHEALATLPPDQREVIQRHYLEHQSLEEVAEAMSRTKDAVRGICYRARQSLRTSLGHSSWFFSG